MKRSLGVLIAIAFLGSCGGSSFPPSGGCGFDYQASLSLLDPATGEVTDSEAVGWPSGQDPILFEGSILEIETKPDSMSLVARGHDLTKEWSVVIGDLPYSQDFQVHQNLALITDEKAVTAVSLDTHDIAWAHGFSSSRVSPPAVSGAGVFVPAGRRITALDIGTGEIMWSRAFESHPITPVATDGLVVSGASRPSYGSEIGPLRALDTQTGNVVWRTDLPGGRTFRPRLIDSGSGIVTDMEVGLGGTRTTLVGIDKTSGDEQWRRTFERDEIWEFVFERGTMIVVRARPARVKALDVATGDTRFGVRIPRGWALFDAALRGNELLLASRNRRAIDLRASEHGEVVWKTRIEAARIPRFAGTVGADTMMALTDQQESNRGDLARLGQDGNIVWRTKFPHPLVMKPVVAQDELFVLSADPMAGCV